MDPQCANCGASLTGPFCAQCGEKRMDPHDLSFKHFLHELFHEFTHVEGRWWSTLRLLLTKPGVLAQEYLAGRRSTYVRPLRLNLLMVIPAFFLVKQSGLSLMTLTKIMPLMAQVADWGAKAQGLSTAAYVAQRNVVFQDWGGFAIKFVSTAVAILLCFLFWHRQRPRFGEHAVYMLYTAAATDPLTQLLSWAGVMSGVPMLVSITTLLAYGYIIAYWFLAARRVYGQGRGLTLCKVVTLLVLLTLFNLMAIGVCALVALPVVPYLLR